MDKIHFYRGTYTDGKLFSHNIRDFKYGGLNYNFFSPSARWNETPFTGIRFAEPRETFNSSYYTLLNKNTVSGLNIEEYAKELRAALIRYWFSVLDENEKYICFHSGGYDSRIISLTLMEVRNMGYDNLTRNIHFRCHQPEEPMFLEIMKRQGWDKSQYSVYEGPREDYYDIGRMDRPMNGWQHYNQQMNFWSDIAPNENEWIVISGLGGEMFKYLGVGVEPLNIRVENKNLNLLIDHYPNEGQWEGYWRTLFKELLMPFWSYEYLSVSTQANPILCEFSDGEDTVRCAVVESFIGTHGIDCRNIEYGRHDYSWNISDGRKKDMVDAFYASQFYNNHKDIMPDSLDFFSTHPDRWYVDSYLWGLMTCYEKMI